jgi:hypothetical protein
MPSSSWLRVSLAALKPSVPPAVCQIVVMSIITADSPVKDGHICPLVENLRQLSRSPSCAGSTMETQDVNGLSPKSSGTSCNSGLYGFSFSPAPWVSYGRIRGKFLTYRSVNNRCLCLYLLAASFIAKFH